MVASITLPAAQSIRRAAAGIDIAAQGLMWAVLLGILLWAAVVGSIALVRGCHERATVESGRSQAVEVTVTQALSRATVTDS